MPKNLFNGPKPIFTLMTLSWPLWLSLVSIRTTFCCGCSYSCSFSLSLSSSLVVTLKFSSYSWCRTSMFYRTTSWMLLWPCSSSMTMVGRGPASGRWGRERNERANGRKRKNRRTEWAKISLFFYHYVILPAIFLL